MKNLKSKIKNLKLLIVIILIMASATIAAPPKWRPGGVTTNSYYYEIVDVISNNFYEIEKFLDTSQSDQLRVDGADIKSGSIPLSALASDSVNSSKVVDNSLTSDDLAPNSVTVSELDDDAVTTDKIDAQAVTSEKIRDEAVTAAKLDSAVQSDIDEWQQGGTVTGTFTIFNYGDDKIRYTPFSDSRVYLDNEMSQGGSAYDWYADYVFAKNGTWPFYQLLGFRWYIGSTLEMALYPACLDVCGNKITNLLAGTDNLDAANVGQVKSMTNSVLIDAKSYADSKTLDLSIVSNQFLLRSGGNESTGKLHLPHGMRIGTATGNNYVEMFNSPARIVFDYYQYGGSPHNSRVNIELLADNQLLVTNIWGEKTKLQIGEPTLDCHAATKAYVDAATNAIPTQAQNDNRYINVSGDTMSGDLTITNAIILMINNYVGSNTKIGYNAGYGSANGDNNVYIGLAAGIGSSGSTNRYSGYASALYASGNNNDYNGYGAGAYSTGDFNVYSGPAAGNHALGNENVYSAPYAGKEAIGTNNYYLGHYAGTNTIAENTMFLGEYKEFNINNVPLTHVPNPTLSNHVANKSYVDLYTDTTSSQFDALTNALKQAGVF